MDTNATTKEENWYEAESDWAAIRAHCKAWAGPRDLRMVSVFDRSKKMCRTWMRHGHQAEAYDIEHDATRNDIVSRLGFFILLDLLMRLAPESFSMWAPPCSLFIFFTSSLHMRHHYGPLGDVVKYSVRLSNRISINASVALKAVLKFRPDCFAMVEQPSGSWLFKAKPWQRLISAFYMQKTLTYQGLFGGPLPKPTHLLHTLPSDAKFARKLTRKLREKKNFKGNGDQVYYIKGPGGKVQGTKMLTKTSIYPQGLCTAIYKAWEESSE